MNDFAEYCAYVYANRERATCQHCGHSIYRLYDKPGESWFHEAGNHRGCRAAAYDRDGGWNKLHDSLVRKYATPRK